MKMKKFLILIAFISLSVNLFAADKDINSKLPEITTISIDGDVIVTLIQDENNRIEGLIPDNQIKNFTWTVTNGTTLEIKLKRPLNVDNLNAVSPVKLNVYVSKLNKIKCKRGASLISDDVLDAKILSFDLSRNSVVSLPIKCVDLSADISLSSALTLRGETQFATIKCSSASIVDNLKLDIKSAVINAYTDSKCYVKASEKLALTSKTYAQIYYVKTDAVVTQSTSLSGTISLME